MRRVAAALILGLLLGACASGVDGAGGGADADLARGGDGTVPEVQAAPGGDDQAASVGEGGPALPAVGPQVIKTAEVSLEVNRGAFQEALRKATAVAGRYGGFVASTSVEGQADRQRSGTVILRVPSERFEAALADVHGLGKVEQETASGEDVSQEFVDLEARLRNLKGQEAVLLRLYERARTIADTIRIQQEVSRVQLEIEQIEGRLRFLRDRASLGTITVTLFEPGVVAPEPKNAFHRAWDQAVDTAVAVTSGLIVALGTVGPVLVLLGVPALLVWRRVRPRPSPPG